MQLDFNAAAHDNKCYVVGACGFDSIPADMGTVFLEEKLGGQVNSVETYLQINSKLVWFSDAAEKRLQLAKYVSLFQRARGHFATWQSAIHGFANASELKPLRKKLFPERLPSFKPTLKSRFVLLWIMIKPEK